MKQFLWFIQVRAMQGALINKVSTDVPGNWQYKIRNTPCGKYDLVQD
jgi:hypothetical protein